MNRKLHSEFLKTAQGMTPRLHAAISECGVLPKQRPNHQPLSTVLCRTIAGQQLSVKAARTIWSRVVEASGTTPLPKYLSKASASQLRTCGLSRAKGRAMKEIARAANAGHLDSKVLTELSQHERSQQLMKIWGVGQWTADMIEIFYFNSADIWPQTDITVVNTLQKLIGYRRKTSLAAAQFAPQRSSLARYMWKIADAPPNDKRAP